MASFFSGCYGRDRSCMVPAIALCYEVGKSNLSFSESFTLESI